jgi:hypothetical protein
MHLRSLDTHHTVHALGVSHGTQGNGFHVFARMPLDNVDWFGWALLWADA